MSGEQDYDPDDILAEFDDEELFDEESGEVDGDTAELDFERTHADEDLPGTEFDDLGGQAA